MRNCQLQIYTKNNSIHKKSYRRFLSGAYLFLVIFLLPVPAAASVPDENGIFSEEMENSLDNESSVNNSSGDDFSDHNFNSTDNREPGSDSSSGSDSQSPDSDNSSSDLDGFFSGDDTSSSSKDKTIHVIIENGNSSNDLNGNGSAIIDPGADNGTISGDGYTDGGSGGYTGGSSGSSSSGEVILHKPQLLLEDSNLDRKSVV